MPGVFAFDTVANMHDGDVDPDLELPLVHRLALHHYTRVQILAIDVAAVLLLTILCEFFLPHEMSRVSGDGWSAAGWAAWVTTSCATLCRRRFPRATLAFLVPVVLLSTSMRADGPTVFYLVLAVYSVVAISSRRVGLIVVTTSGAVTMVGVIVGGGAQVVPATIGAVALIVLGWLAGENTRASRIYGAQRTERAAAERASIAQTERAEQVRRAVADERVEIARELHDIVAHAMSVITVRAGVARMVVDTRPEQAREALGIIETTTRRSLQEMRLLVGVLRDADDPHAELGPVPGLADLDRLVSDIELGGVQVDVAIDGPPRRLAPAVDLSAYRIVQEALTNVVRHAAPTHACLHLGYHPDQLSIEIVDDGPDPHHTRDPGLLTPGSGHGLIGMRERAALFDGEITAEPWEGGFRVRTSLHTDGLHFADVES